MDAATDALDDAPAVRQLAALISEAHEHRASDVHVEPTQTAVQIRWRIDGVLTAGPQLDRSVHASLMARLKVLAELNLVERRRPQDGQFRFANELGDVDVRVATMPTVHGERATLRITEVGRRVRDLAGLGLPNDLMCSLERALRAPSGMLLCVGPTGAGKTTTLYAALGHLADGTRHLATIEDPVEHLTEGVTQIQVNEPSGLTFSAGLRALLRHDPDVILVGEIRDRETAQVAVQAALSGHLVLSSLHASDAVGALARLVDLGVDRHLVAAAVTAVVAQRLLRRVCSPGKPRHHEPGYHEPRYHEPRYHGQAGAFELLVTTPALRQLVIERAGEDALRTQARRDGLRPLSLAAEDLARQGVTTASEVLRITTHETHATTTHATTTHATTTHATT
jgi:type IV pilus assembly protein PilB